MLIGCSVLPVQRVVFVAGGVVGVLSVERGCVVARSVKKTRSKTTHALKQHTARRARSLPPPPSLSPSLIKRLIITMHPPPTTASPSYADWCGPSIATLKYRRLSSDGDAEMPGTVVWCC